VLDSKWRISFAMTLAFILCIVPLRVSGQAMQVISIDASRSAGTIKRVNDVDNGPLCQRGIVDLSPYYKELGIRNVRLHDVPWTYDNVLDINYVFPNWNADPSRPESYDFQQSDFYIKSITDLGINIIFRLGYSAEYKTSVRHDAPPDSFDKWADVAAHIVAHYNQGWANGPKANIRYWEIGNEPDGDGLVFWKGTPESFYRLYDVVARKVKSIDPTLKVGGPAIVGSLPFLRGFLLYSQQHHSPVDFVSWHIYTQDPQAVVRHANDIHQLMTQYGYQDAENILDEWNYGPSDWRKMFVDPVATREYFDAAEDSYGAAFDATVMTDLQDAPVDIATFYSGTTFMWGLFTSSGAPQKPYYTFLAFQRLLETPKRIAIKPLNEENLVALAGVSEDSKTVRILVTNLAREKRRVHLEISHLPWNSGSAYEQRVVDSGHDLSTMKSGPVLNADQSIDVEVDGPSVSLITVHPITR
jgi:xylan 1,4-beta-xylosidase